jgi:chromosome segregation ATPase
VDAAALHARHCNASDRVLQLVAATLSGVVPDAYPVHAIENIARRAQESVARLVDQVLRLADEEAPRTAARHASRMLELLNDLAETLRPSAFSWRRGKSPRARLAELRPELDSLRVQLERAESTLRASRNRFASLQIDVREAAEELEAGALSCVELREVFKDNRRLQAVDAREVALSKSLALLETHALQMNRMQDDFTQLADRIRDAVLHALPAWLSAVAATSDILNDTERFNLMDQLQAVIRELSH